MERAAFQRIAPHLSHYLPFVIPTYQAFAKGADDARRRGGAASAAVRLANSALADPAKRVPRRDSFSGPRCWRGGRCSPASAM